MTFSEVLSSFYQILLGEDARESVDREYSGCAHHRALADLCVHQRDLHLFHLDLYHSHLYALLSIIHDEGYFGHAIDPSGKGNDWRESWSPASYTWDAEDAFRGLPSDHRYGLGQLHPLLDIGVIDLKDLKIPTRATAIIRNMVSDHEAA
jgi:hypothetical protein